MIALTMGTPRYVLLRERERLEPKLLALTHAPTYSAIFGFSDKPAYDRFCQNCSVAVTPYPLVQRYLRERCDEVDATVKLVVIDAVGPSEMVLHATTMDCVLAALESKAASLTPSFSLRFDSEFQAYRVEKF
jgi:hypothetical protein